MNNCHDSHMTKGTWWVFRCYSEASGSNSKGQLCFKYILHAIVLILCLFCSWSPTVQSPWVSLNSRNWGAKSWKMWRIKNPDWAVYDLYVWVKLELDFMDEDKLLCMRVLFKAVLQTSIHPVHNWGDQILFCACMCQHGDKEKSGAVFFNGRSSVRIPPCGQIENYQKYLIF